MATLQPLGTNRRESYRAWQLLDLHRPELALSVCERLLAQNPNDVSAMLAQAEALRQLNRLPEAAMAARTAVAKAPESALAHYHWARMLGQQGAFWDAESAAKNAIRLSPNDAESYGLLAQLQCMLLRQSEALTSANAGLALNAQHVNCLLWRAVSLEKISGPQMADEGFHEVLRLAPTNAQVHSLRGQVLLQRAEPNAANWHLSEALRLDATDSALIPLLRRARRWQHWPKWMVRRHQQMRRCWHQERYLGNAESATALLLPFFLLLSWWRNWHDPIFRLTRTQVWRLRRGLWLTLILIIPALIIAGEYFGWFDASKPFSIPQMLALAAGGCLFHLGIHLMTRKITAESSP